MSEETKLFWVTKAEFDEVNRHKITVWNKRNDIRTAIQIAPHGIDSVPVKNVRAVYGRTGIDGPTFISGYFNKGLLAGPGEIRLYSTNENGDVQGQLWLKNNGTLELLGNSDNAVLFNKLKIEYNSLKQSHNDLVTKFNDLVTKWNAFTAAYVPGSPSTTGLPATLAASAAVPGTPDTSNIDNAKNSRIKTND